MKRIEKKFLLTEAKFMELLQDFQKDYDILEIDGKHIFGYDNIYMDTAKYDFYWQHENNESNRTKVRFRNYLDSDELVFFEYKNKVNGVTHKTRCQISENEHGKMCSQKKGFFTGIYSKIYGTQAPEISPSLQTRYKRCTLVDKKARERLTIDFHIETRDLRDQMSPHIRMENLVIVESKSLLEKSPSQEILEKYDISGAKSCSKYALGIIYSGLAEKWSRFQNTIQQIKEIRNEYLQRVRMISQRSPLKETKDRFKKTPLQTSLIH